ncbi:WD40-repeat-containing domain protein [Gaertneriomyces semiglobifer]|nr:WD40-repeat-containing domain protein [Gaertneriomyces semiglobifer]
MQSTQDIDLLALSLISGYLEQRGLSATLECLRTEAFTHFQDLERHPVLHDRPLTALLEDYQQASLQKKLGALRLNSAAVALEFAPKVCARLPFEPSRCLEGVHFANIIATTSVKLPSSLFPSENLPSSTVTVVATSSTDKTVKLSDGDSGKVLAVLDHHKAAVLAMAFHPKNPCYLLTAGMDGAHHIVDIRTGTSVQNWHDHAKYVTQAGFSTCDDGTYLVTASYDKTVNIYRQASRPAVADDRPLYEKVHTMTFNGAVESICFLDPAHRSASNAHPTLVVGTRDDNYLHYIELDGAEWKDSTVNMNANNDNWVSFTPMSLCPSPTGDHIACYTDSKAGRIIIFRARSSIQVKNLYGVVADGFSQPRCCWDASGRFLFATSDDQKIYVFDVFSGQIESTLAGHTGTVRSLAYDLDRNWLLSASFDKTVRVWETREVDGVDSSPKRQ